MKILSVILLLVFSGYVFAEQVPCIHSNIPGARYSVPPVCWEPACQPASPELGCPGPMPARAPAIRMPIADAQGNLYNVFGDRAPELITGVPGPNPPTIIELTWNLKQNWLYN